MKSSLFNIPLSLVKHFLRVDHDDDDDLLMTLLKSAENKIKDYSHDCYDATKNNDQQKTQDLIIDQKSDAVATIITDVLSLVSSLYDKSQHSPFLSNRKYRL